MGELCDGSDKHATDNEFMLTPTETGRDMRPPSEEARKHREVMKTGLARRLRREATDAERRLWGHLRRKQMSGMKFRRQHPVGPYIVDFCCPAAKLVVELDGGQHGEPQRLKYDERRTRWLVAAGYRVIRFANHDVFKEQQVVLDAIWHALQKSGAPLPPEPPLPTEFRETEPTLP